MTVHATYMPALPATGGVLALAIVVVFIVFWVCVIVAYFSMANDLSKMRKELVRLTALVEIQTEELLATNERSRPRSLQVDAKPFDPWVDDRT
ncbi:hypothetical protein [Demequina sp.]|uniref:hypothetical protein n=1 Tax=Demequina sp. TaxID=2050685 RepID=UPI003A854E70